MKIIKLHDLHFKLFIFEDEIAKIVKKIAFQVKADLDKNEIPIIYRNFKWMFFICY